MSVRAASVERAASCQTNRRPWVGELALSELCEHMPGFASLALWLRHVERPHETGYYARTDGTNIIYGAAFWEIDTREQRSTQAHEVLHAALRHPARMAAMQRDYGDSFSAMIANAAADAIVNSALGGQRWFRLTDADPTIENVMASARALRAARGLKAPAKDPCDRSAQEWSFETLYAFMHDLATQASASQPAECTGIGFEPRQEGRLGGDIIAVDFAPPAPDGVGGEGPKVGTADSNLEESVRTWSRRLMGLSAGRDTGRLVRNLEGDLPRVRTPWERHLRDVIGTALAPVAKPTWTVPNRRGADAPGWRRSEPTPKLVVIQDTSGSIDGRMLARFAAEIMAIARRRGAQITAISADAAVTEVIQPRGDDVKDVLKRLRGIGGGGTDFAPALRAAAALKPDAIVYLTDLCGNFGPAPGCKVIWAVLERNADLAGQVPFGRVVKMH